MAIYLLEYMQLKDMRIPVQIFATDLNDATIEMARTGFYTKAAVQHISPLRLRKFFVKIEGGYQVAKAIRDMCIFATHNFLKDPPYARMDIISCQHILLSLEQAAQQKALRAFHYALKPGGFMALDRKEVINGTEQFFTHVYKELNVYTKLTGPFSTPFEFSSASLQTVRERKGSELQAADMSAGPGGLADKIMLARYVPAGILVDSEGQILRFYGITAPYLRPQAGKASLDLLKIIHEDLVHEIRALLPQARRQGVPVTKKEIWLRVGEEAKEVTVDVVPVRQFPHFLQLIIIRESQPEREDAPPDAAAVESAARIRVRELEQSLMEAGKQMLAMHEEFDSTRSDLQAAHEELLSSNEELQSINEELITMNEEVVQRNAELKESIEYAEAIVETIRQPLLDLYSDLRIRKANKAFYAFFHLTYDEVEGNYLSEIADGFFDIPRLMDKLKLTISKRVPFEDLEWGCAIPGECEKTILFNATRISGQPGKRARILLVLEDNTQRKLLEKKKDEFISIASHELKTPATSIQAYTQILYNEFVEANDQRSAQLVSKLNNQVIRLTNLTSDLLDETKITQGQLRLKENFFDVNTMVEETIEEMQRMTSVCLAYSPKLSQLKFWGDRDRLAQVLRNLVANAIRYSSTDKQVLITLDKQDKTLLLRVQDFGIGMTPEIQEKIFDRFFRVDDPAIKEHSGLGLGLYISYEIVRQHGGNITVQSEKGEGSIFTVILPDRKEFSPVV